MLKLSLPFSALLFCSSLNLFAAPAPLESLTGQTFILKGEAFQAKFAITADGLGRIWRPDGYSTLKWTEAGDNLVATLDTPLESPYQGADAQGNPVMGVTRLESLTFTFAEGQKIVADVKETYRDIFPPESGLPESTEEYDNPALPFVNYNSLKALTPTAGTLLALPLSGEQSAILKVAGESEAVLVEDPLNKAPATFGLSTSDSLVLKLSETSTIRYTVIEEQGLSSVLLGEVKANGKESIFISAGGVVNADVYQTPATAAEFKGTYTIPEFAGTDYVFNADGTGKIVATLPDGAVEEYVLTWGEESGLIYAHRWTRKRMKIPVFHDDQHGTAIIATAGLINALELTGKRVEDIKVVFSGGGAAAIACAQMFLSVGVLSENILLCDSKGVVHDDRVDLNAYKKRFSQKTALRTLGEALVGADVFVGVSAAGVLKPDMLMTMAPQPIVFALANPDPEITPDLARLVRPDVIIATGRSDYPNQVNNVLGFPFIFRGALDVQAHTINEEMKRAAAYAIADLARQPVPLSVQRVYQREGLLKFGRDYLIPKPNDPRALAIVASAVAEAAMISGVAHHPIDILAYRERLSTMLTGDCDVN